MTETDVTVIGLGAMGSALAECFLKAGRAVTVWNRSLHKADPLVKQGAQHVVDVAMAVEASKVTVVNLLDDQAVQAVLAMPRVTNALSGRTLVNLTTTWPGSATTTAQTVHAAGARYLDGGINAYPRQVGLADTVFLYSGDQDAFEEHAPLLRLLAGSQRFVGVKHAAAKTVYLALWTYYLAALQGFCEGAALAAAGADMPVPAFRTLIRGAIEGLLVNGLDDAAHRIASQAYGGEQATVDVHEYGSRAMLGAFNEVGLMPPVLSAYAKTLQQAQAQGRGSQDISALFEVVRAPIAEQLRQ